MSNPSNKVSAKINKSEAPQSNNTLYIIYAVLSLILISFIVLIFLKIKKNNEINKEEVKEVRVATDLDKGFDICNEASRMYQADNDKAREALELLETGIAQIEKELNKFRDADGNLPAMYEGYETRVTIKRAFRKTLKDKAFMLNAAEERKQETDRASAQK